MSQPNIPDINPEINLNTIDVLNIILASIGFEELALAHLLNAEAEKIQFALGTLESELTQQSHPTFEQLLSLNKSVERVLLTISHKELILLNKLQETVNLIEQLPVDGNS